MSSIVDGTKRRDTLLYKLLRGLARTIRYPFGLLGERIVEKNRVIQEQEMADEYSLNKAIAYWQFVPAGYDAGGQISSADLLTWSDTDLLTFHQTHLQHRHQTDWEVTLRSWLEPCITDETLILDFGCGLGHSGWDIYTTLGGQIIFADIVSSHLNYIDRLIALQHAKAQTLLLSDTEEIWDIQYPLDIILVLGVLHHIPKPDRIVTKFRQHLKSGGLVVLLLYNTIHFRRQGVFSLKDYANRSESLSGNPYTNYYTKERVITLMQGFQLLQHYTSQEAAFDIYLFERVETSESDCV